MVNLKQSILQIESLLAQGTEASLTYAALECRLSIEMICYERLRLAHDYISHDDLKKWQPAAIVNILIQEVDSTTAETFTLSISKETQADGSPPPTLEEYQAMDFVQVGTQIGFNPNKLKMLWNALANLALHINLPTSSAHMISRYGDQVKIKTKIKEALVELHRIDQGTLIYTGLGEEISFECYCGAKNKRRLALLRDGQTISCINPECTESYNYVAADLSFGRRTFSILCRACGTQRDIPKKMVEKLSNDQHIHFDCDGCGEKIYLSWRPMQAQKTKSTDGGGSRSS